MVGLAKMAVNFCVDCTSTTDSQSSAQRCANPRRHRRMCNGICFVVVVIQKRQKRRNLGEKCVPKMYQSVRIRYRRTNRGQVPSLYVSKCLQRKKTMRLRVSPKSKCIIRSVCAPSGTQYEKLYRLPKSLTTILKLTGLRKAQKASATRWCQDASSSLCGCDNLALCCIGVQFCKCASGMGKHRRNWTGENGR